MSDFFPTITNIFIPDSMKQVIFDQTGQNEYQTAPFGVYIHDVFILQ